MIAASTASSLAGHCLRTVAISIKFRTLELASKKSSPDGGLCLIDILDSQPENIDVDIKMFFSWTLFGSPATFRGDVTKLGWLQNREGKTMNVKDCRLFRLLRVVRL